jgi:hypothetical protein
MRSAKVVRPNSRPRATRKGKRRLRWKQMVKALPGAVIRLLAAWLLSEWLGGVDDWFGDE